LSIIAYSRAGADSKCGATFVDMAFLNWLQKMVVGEKLLPEGMATGGHSVSNPLTELLLHRFKPIKEMFDDIDSGLVQLPRQYRNAEGKTSSIRIAEGYEDIVNDGAVSISR
jgi:hypothetical protein